MRLLKYALLVFAGITVSCETLPPELADLRFHVAEYEDDIDDWFGQHTLQAKPALSAFNFAYKKPRFEPGDFTASLDARTSDFFDGVLLVEVTGRKVAESKAAGGTPKIKDYRFKAVIELEADTSSGGFFKLDVTDMTAKPRNTAVLFRDAVQAEIEGLVTTWLKEVEDKIVQAYASGSPQLTLDGAMVIVQDEVEYVQNGTEPVIDERTGEPVIDPATNEPRTRPKYDEIVEDRWVLFVAKRAP